jgi:hypothetical protein
MGTRQGSGVLSVDDIENLNEKRGEMLGSLLVDCFFAAEI